MVDPGCNGLRRYGLLPSMDCSFFIQLPSPPDSNQQRQQTLGVALPWGIASCLVRPHEKTLSISGDGGFLFSGMELETAVRLKLNLVHMIWIDGTYDMVAVQERAKYKRTSGVDFGPVDVVT